MNRLPGIPLSSFDIQSDSPHHRVVVFASHWMDPTIQVAFYVTDQWLLDCIQTMEWIERYIQTRAYVLLHIKYIARGS